MKFSICNETFQNHDFIGTCVEAARHGYRGLEVAPFTLGDVSALTEKKAEDFGAVVRDEGFEMVGLSVLLGAVCSWAVLAPIVFEAGC